MENETDNYASFRVSVKDSMVDQYLAFHNYMTTHYKKALVMFQCGDFFEQYAKEDKSGNTIGADLILLSKTLDYLISDRGDFKLVGFNKKSFEVAIGQLFKHYDHIAVVVEVESDKVSAPSIKKTLKRKDDHSRKERRIYRIYTEETYTQTTYYGDESQTTDKTIKNNLICQFFLRVFPIDKKESYRPLIASLSSISVEEGSSNSYQIENNSSDPEIIYEEFNSYFARYKPRLLIMSIQIFGKMTEEELTLIKNKFLSNLDNSAIKIIYQDVATQFLKLDYQLQFLDKLMIETKKDSSLNSIERLGLERKPESVIGYILLLQYIYEKHGPLVERIPQLVVLENTQLVSITTDAINQLSIYQDLNQERSLFDILNYTKSPMGQRLLLNRILCPIIDGEELEHRYSLIDHFLNDNRWKRVNILLDGFVDLDAYNRKSVLGTINPTNILHLLSNYDKVLDILKECLYSVGSSKKRHIFPPKFKTKFQSFMSDFNVLRRDADGAFLRKAHTETNVFIEGYDQVCDQLSKKLSINKRHRSEIIKALNERLQPKSGKALQGIECRIDIKNSIYHFEITAPRLLKLKQSLEDEELILAVGKKTYHFDSSTFTNIGTKMSKKGIVCSSLTELADKYFEAVIKLNERLEILYKEFIIQMVKKWGSFMVSIAKIMAEVDLYSALAQNAHISNYCRPMIDLEDGESYIKARDLRHPIIEKEVQEQGEIYVPNSITLGLNDNESSSGNIILLYGPNMGGKSTLLRSVGSNIFLAQMGSFVAAKSFEFRPFHSIFTRILTKDNAHKSRSSFQVEMLELAPILTRSNANSLVLADEPCHSTNHLEQTSLVSAFLLELGKRGTPSLITTHLYELTDQEAVREITGLSVYHLALERKGEKLIYKRTLKKGVGERYTALDVARAAGIPQKVLEDALMFKRKLLNENEQFLAFKTSNYNSKLFMDKCERCGLRKAIETHHKRPQKDVDSRGYVDHVPIHSSGNLERLCQECHAKETFGEKKSDE